MAIQNLKRNGLTPGIIHKNHRVENFKNIKTILTSKMKLIIPIFLIIALSLNAKALAVASDYLENNTLTLIEGGSGIYSIRLQNPDSYEARFKVDYDMQFMKAIEFNEEYAIPPASSVRIEFNVTAPEYNQNNNLFAVSYTVHQLSSGSGGTFFLTKISKNFKLKVEKIPNADKNQDKPDVKYDNGFHINYGYAAYAIAVLAFLLYVFRKKLAKNNKAQAKKILRKIEK